MHQILQGVRTQLSRWSVTQSEPHEAVEQKARLQLLRNVNYKVSLE
jgi:hypothetical protein